MTRRHRRRPSRRRPQALCVGGYLARDRRSVFVEGLEEAANLNQFAFYRVHHLTPRPNGRYRWRSAGEGQAATESGSRPLGSRGRKREGETVAFEASACSWPSALATSSTFSSRQRTLVLAAVLGVAIAGPAALVFIGCGPGGNGSPKDT